MTGRRLSMCVAAAVVLLLGVVGQADTSRAIHVEAGENLQAAIDAAPRGAVLVLDAGVHRGPIVVRRPMTLRGAAGAELVGTGVGSVVTVRGERVRIESLAVSRSGRRFADDDAGVLVLGDRARIENLHLRNNLHGIYVRRAKSAHLVGNRVVGLAATEKNLADLAAQQAKAADGVHHDPPQSQSLMGNGLHLFDADDALVANNHIHHVRDGIYVAHTSGSVFRGNRIHDSRYGIHYMYSSDNAILDNELWRNVAGPALMFSRNLEVANNIMRDHSGLRAYGLLLQNIDSSSIHDNDIRGNRVGMRLQYSSDNSFVANRIAGNLSGLTINSSSRENRFTHNTFGFNLHQVELTGPAPHTQWSVDGLGNRWHGAMPLDLDGDGVYDWPHHEVDLMAQRREKFPPVQLLVGSPGIRGLEWALKRAPLPRLRYVTDPHPLAPGHRHD